RRELASGDAADPGALPEPRPTSARGTAQRPPRAREAPRELTNARRRQMLRLGSGSRPTLPHWAADADSCSPSRSRSPSPATQAPVLAHHRSRTLEPSHGAVYFLPEATEASAGRGVGGREAYFGARSAPLGEVRPDVVVATFFNFNPSLFHDALPIAWSATTP